MSSWRANAFCIASGWSSHSRVEPSRSVNRNVTVPDGNSRIDQLVFSEREPADLVTRHRAAAVGECVELLRRDGGDQRRPTPRPPGAPPNATFGANCAADAFDRRHQHRGTIGVAFIEPD